MSIIKPHGSHLIVSMSDLDRADPIHVNNPLGGSMYLDDHQIDPTTGLLLGGDRHPHQGVIVGRGPRVPDPDLTLGTTVMVVADLGRRWDHQGMMVQSVRTTEDHSPGCQGVPTDPVFAVLDGIGTPKAPAGRVIAVPCNPPASDTLATVGSLGESIQWAEVVSVGDECIPDIQPGVKVGYEPDAGVRWSGDTDYISLRARARGCRCGRSRAEVVAIDLTADPA